MDFEGVNCTNSDNLISACIECTAYETHIGNERRREEKKFIERTEKGIRRQSEKIKTTSKQKIQSKSFSIHAIKVNHFDKTSNE